MPETEKERLSRRTAIRARVVAKASHIAFLKRQRDQERLMRGDLRWLSDRIASVLRRHERKGVVPTTSLKPIMDKTLKLNHAAYASIGRDFAVLYRFALTAGITSGLANMRDVLRSAVEHDAIEIHGLKLNLIASKPIQYSTEQNRTFPSRQNYPLKEAFTKSQISAFLKARRIAKFDPNNPQMVRQITEFVATRKALDLLLKRNLKPAKTSTIFRRMFSGAKRRAMSDGLFGGPDATVSSRVWAVRDQNALQLRRIISSGVSRGASAAEISRDIRGLLLQPNTLRGAALDASTPGTGVYRSAYKNALRVTRTESNRAFTVASLQVARAQDWKVRWRVTGGVRGPCPICNALDGQVMTADEFYSLYPPHPHCLCYDEKVLPNIDDEDRLELPGKVVVP